jgi:type II secretory pathway pseudopilin PulG
MKFFSYKKGGFSLLQIIIVIALLAVLAALTMPKAQAQPYFTNANTIYGAQGYNNNLATPLKPSATLAAQYASGTLAGVIPPGSFVAGNGGFYTNTFGTNLYSVAPFVIVSSSITNNTPAVTSVTTSNCVIQANNTNATFYWEATGH